MTKLKNAPLLEVVFELHWDGTRKESLDEFQFLFGDLYSKLENDYKYRETLLQSGQNNLLIKTPAFRARRVEGGYPLFQVGPDILTLNTDHENYSRKDYFSKIKTLITTFSETSYHSTVREVTPKLTFIDYYSIDFEREDAVEFLNKWFNVNLEQNFMNERKPVKLDLNYTFDTDIGELFVGFRRGNNLKLKKEGLIVTTRVTGIKKETDVIKIMKWVDHAKEKCQKLFEEMTKGELYNSFNE